MSWLSRIKNALSQRRPDEDLTDEIRDHIERRIADLRDRGISAPDAQRQAALAFGNITAIRERSREIRLWVALDETLQDLRYAWRGLLRNPAFAITTIASVGLAIGANTAIYSIVDAALLRPRPVPQPQRLFALSTSRGNRAIPIAQGNDIFSYSMYEQLCSVAADSARLALFNSPNRVEARASTRRCALRRSDPAIRIPGHI